MEQNSAFLCGKSQYEKKVKLGEVRQKPIPFKKVTSFLHVPLSLYVVLNWFPFREKPNFPF